MKKIFSLLLILALLVSCTVSVAAEDAPTDTRTLRVVSFNVDGLPIPSFLSSTKRPAAKATRLIARELNNADVDILCAQEDFNYHSILKKDLGMNYATISSGPAVIGDGLNIFSVYPLYNVRREAWESAYGVFDCGSDELTPKGILYCTVEIDPGIYIDVYTLHADAWEDDDSMLAKAAQFDQLKRMIEQNSADRAVLLTGDFNVNYSIFRAGYANGSYPVDLCAKLLDNFVADGFSDAWIEANNEGNYDFTYAEMRERYGCEYPRVWDTLDHIFYRSGAGVTLTLTDAYYNGFDCEDITWDGHLSDHAAVCADFTVSIDRDNASTPEALETEKLRPLDQLTDAVAALRRTLGVVFAHLPELWEKGVGWIK